MPPFRSKLEKEPLKKGDQIRLASPGGGGFGDPLERHLEDVEEDLNQGLIDHATAETVYGAVIARVTMLSGRPIYRLDQDASRERRRSQVRRPSANSKAKS